MEKPLKTYTFTFNPRDNGGEQLHLFTSIYDNGDAFAAGHSARGRSAEAALKGGIYLIHELVLNSYGNQATITFGDGISPADFRRLADELESAIHEADAVAVHSGIEHREKKVGAA